MSFLSARSSLEYQKKMASWAKILAIGFVLILLVLVFLYLFAQRCVEDKLNSKIEGAARGRSDIVVKYDKKPGGKKVTHDTSTTPDSQDNTEDKQALQDPTPVLDTADLADLDLGYISD